MLSHFRHIQLFTTLQTITTKLLYSWNFPGKSIGVVASTPPSGDLPDPGIKPESLMSPALVGGFFTTAAPHGKPFYRAYPPISNSALQPSDQESDNNNKPFYIFAKNLQGQLLLVCLMEVLGAFTYIVSYDPSEPYSVI